MCDPPLHFHLEIRITIGDCFEYFSYHTYFTLLYLMNLLRNEREDGCFGISWNIECYLLLGYIGAIIFQYQDIL